jgi:hypothetical protein
VEEAKAKKKKQVYKSTDNVRHKMIATIHITLQFLSTKQEYLLSPKNKNNFN